PRVVIVLLGHAPGLQPVVQPLVGEIQVPFGRADRVHRVIGRHAMVGLVPAHGIGARVHAQHYVGTILADQPRHLLHQVARVGVFQHAVVVLQPQDALLCNAHDAAGLLFFVHADARQALAGHVGVIRSLVVVGVDDDVDLVAVFRQLVQRAGAAERV